MILFKKDIVAFRIKSVCYSKKYNHKMVDYIRFYFITFFYFDLQKRYAAQLLESFCIIDEIINTIVVRYVINILF